MSTTLLDKYRVTGVIGSGPIGAVLEVEDISNKTRYAAKLIHPRFTRENPDDAEKTIIDLQKVAGVQSPHIAKIFMVGRDTGYAITTIRELMQGECLASRMKQVGQFSLLMATKTVREILSALDAIHRVNVFNHDLSPGDVFLCNTDQGMTVKLVDIGERHIKRLLTTDQSTWASTQYYAPEQLDRSRQPNQRADIYAAGAILYQMLTGTVPPGEPAPLETFRKDIPVPLSQAVMKALSPTANNRFETASEFIAALDAINLTHPSNAPAAATLNSASSEETKSAEPDSETKNKMPASVIVEMPEIQKKGSKLPLLLGGIVLLFAALAGGWHILSTPEEMAASQALEDVTIEIRVIPENATISVDGKRKGTNPVQLTVPKDASLHTISAKAAGFETVERDIRFDETRTINLELFEIIQPDDAEEMPSVDIQALPNNEPSPDSRITSPSSETFASTKKRAKPGVQKAKTVRAEKKKKHAPTIGGKKTLNSKKNKKYKGFSKENPFE